MNTINFKNGSKIVPILTPNAIRSNNSNKISFWCDNCKKVHESVQLSEMICLDDNTVICRTSCIN